MEELSKIEMVLLWAQDHPNFNTDFILNLKDAVHEYGDLTYAQSEALDNIIEKFRAEKQQKGSINKEENIMP